MLSLAVAIALSAAPFVLDGHRLELPSEIGFLTGKAELTTASDAALEHVKSYLEAKAAITLLRVEVHTDSMGNEKANQALTEARAAAVVKALVKKGVDCHWLIAVGFGSSKPVAPNDTPENRALNRRTLFINAAMLKRPIGGMPVDGGGIVAPIACD